MEKRVRRKFLEETETSRHRRYTVCTDSHLNKNKQDEHYFPKRQKVVKFYVRIGSRIKFITEKTPESRRKDL